MPPRGPYVPVTPVYGDQNLQKTVSMSKGFSTHEAKERAEVELSPHLSTLYNLPKIKFDPERTDIHPKPNPASEDLTLGELDGEMTMILWSQEDPASELLELRSKKAAAVSTAEESAMPKSSTACGRETKEQEVTASVTAEDILAQITSFLKMRMTELDLRAETEDIKQLRADTERFKADTEEFKADNQRLDGRIRNMHQGLEDIKQFLVLIAPTHIRVLLDGARGKIVGQSPYASWEDLRNSCGMYELKQTIASTHSIPDDLASFICEFVNVPRGGNDAAHTAERRDIRSAVQQEPQRDERRLLEQLYQFVFDEDLTKTLIPETSVDRTLVVSAIACCLISSVV